METCLGCGNALFRRDKKLGKVPPHCHLLYLWATNYYDPLAAHRTDQPSLGAAPFNNDPPTWLHPSAVGAWARPAVATELTVAPYDRHRANSVDQGSHATSRQG